MQFQNLKYQNVILRWDNFKILKWSGWKKKGVITITLLNPAISLTLFSVLKKKKKNTILCRVIDDCVTAWLVMVIYMRTQPLSHPFFEHIYSRSYILVQRILVIQFNSIFIYFILYIHIHTHSCEHGKKSENYIFP